MVIGGAEDKVRDRVILGRFVALAAGRTASSRHLTASLLGLEAGERYRAVFTGPARRGAALHAVPARGQRREYVALVRDATGVFLTGGNQLRLSSTIGGTLLAEAV